MSNPPTQEPEEQPIRTSQYGIPMFKVPVTIKSIDGEVPITYNYEEFLQFPEATIEEYYERVKREEAEREGDRHQPNNGTQ